jgi:hypothetical protein
MIPGMSCDILIISTKKVLKMNGPAVKKTDWEEPSKENGPVDYSVKAEKFYFDMETIGSLKPNDVVELGIGVLQTKLAEIVLALEKLDGAKAGAREYGGMLYTPGDEWARTQRQDSANQWF